MEQNHTYMSYQNLFDIARYSKIILENLSPDAGELPSWINDAISAIRTHMKDVVHFLRYQASRGKHYGQTPHLSYTGRPDIDPVRYAPRAYAAPQLFNSAYMATKNLREVSVYADEALSHTRRDVDIFPAWVEHKLSICAEYLDSIGHWLQNEAAEGRQYGQGAGYPTGARKPGLLYGPGQAGVGPAPGLRRFAASFPPGNGSRPPSSSSVPRPPPTQYSAIPTGPRPDSRASRPGPAPTGFDPHIPPDRIPNNGNGINYQPGYGSHIPGPPPTSPMFSSRMQWVMPPNRMLEVNRMRLPSRMLQEETGRKFGVPGIPYGRPGWAGAGGVEQLPHPSRSMVSTSQLPETYGSLGYASMGEGSMNFAVRGRRMAQTPTRRRRRRRKKNRRSRRGRRL